MNRFFYALMLGAALILSGCDLLDALKPEPELTINKNEFEIASSGDRCTVTVNANYEFDVVIPEDAAEWIKSKISGADGDQVILTISPNKGYDGRTAEVTIKLKEYDLSETVTIVQKQTDALLLDGEDVVLSYEAGTFTIPVFLVGISVSSPFRRSLARTLRSCNVATSRRPSVVYFLYTACSSSVKSSCQSWYSGGTSALPNW